MYRCSIPTSHCTGAKTVTIYWYVGALCWTEKINTSSEREQGSSGVNVKTNYWHKVQIINTSLHAICNKSYQHQLIIYKYIWCRISNSMQLMKTIPSR